MLCNKSALEKKIKDCEKYIANYKVYIAILNKLDIKLNKDGTYPKNPFIALHLVGCEEDSWHYKNYGYRGYILKVGKKYYKVFLTRESDIIDISYTWCEKDGTTHGGRDGRFAFDIDYLDTMENFKAQVKRRIDLFTNNIGATKREMQAYPKIFAQLEKINTYGLSNWEVKDLL